MTLEELKQKEAALMEELREVKNGIFQENRKLVAQALNAAIENLTFVCKTEQDYLFCEVETECEACGCYTTVAVEWDDILDGLKRMRQDYTN